ISVFGTRVYITTGFGLSIYDITNAKQPVFAETITKFGNLADQDTVFAATEANDSIYLALSGNIAIAAKNAQNMRDPSAWKIIPASKGATWNSIVSLKSGKVIAGGSQ